MSGLFVVFPMLLFLVVGRGGRVAPLLLLLVAVGVAVALAGLKVNSNFSFRKVTLSSEAMVLGRILNFDVKYISAKKIEY